MVDNRIPRDSQDDIALACRIWNEHTGNQNVELPKNGMGMEVTEAT